MQHSSTQPITVIIGAGRIGTAIADHLCAAGHDVIVAGHDRIELQDLGSVADFFAPLTRADILINAAGSYASIGPIAKVNPWDWSAAIDINLVGVYACLHYALPIMPAGGHIINIAGGGTTEPIDHLSGYCSAKAALVRLTRIVALENPRLHANVVYPGPMMSRMQQQLLDLGPQRAGSSYERIRRIRDTGEGAVPVENTLRAIDTILVTRCTGNTFYASQFPGPQEQAA